MDDGNKHPIRQKTIRFKKNTIGNKKENKTKWVVFVTFLSFLLSIFFLLISELLFKNAGGFVSFIIVFVIVLIGIVFDIIGIAVTAADEAPFHALGSRKYFGAKRALKLIRNANKVSSFCNDVIGDICGIISGTAGALIAIRITEGKTAINSAVVGLVTGGIIAAVTVGGKAAGKIIAIANSHYIVYNVGRILQFIDDKFIFKNIKDKQRIRKRGKKTGNNLKKH